METCVMNLPRIRGAVTLAASIRLAGKSNASAAPELIAPLRNLCLVNELANARL
jgi:hypothetical protein